ncbi:MAG: glutathione synthase [Betaproteobacteria bacterium]|nr:glutathione synthase [Betaproteobacteria bacterium]
MDFAFLVDPLDTLKTYKDSSVAMMREAARRGHSLHALQQEDLCWREGRLEARVTPIELLEHSDAWYLPAEPQVRAPESFAAIVMRKDPPFDMEYVYSTYLLEAAVAQGARVFNDPRAIRDHNEKLALARHPEFIAPTLVTRREELLREFISEQREVVLKPLDGMGGESIFRVSPSDPNLNVIIETLTRRGTRSIMAQRFIPEIAQGDKRILLIAGEPVPFSLARIPRPGESRGNLAAGGTGAAQPLSPRDAEIAETLGPKLWEKGLFLVGIDVIGDYLTEINVTSPTCFVEISEQTGFNVAGMFLDALEAACP